MSHRLKDVLLVLVGVQAELFLNAPQFARVLLGRIVGETGAMLIDEATKTQAGDCDGCRRAARVDLVAFKIAAGAFVDGKLRWAQPVEW